METKILYLIKLLPKIEELSTITQEEPEAFYIFKNSLNSLQHYHQEYLNSNGNISLIELLEESSYLSESLIEKMWEKINTGHFSEVPISIRKIYSIANYVQIILILLSNYKDKSELEKCCEHLDKAILIGCTESLYEKNSEFLNLLNEFLNQYLDLSADSNLPYIQRIEHEELSCDIATLDCPSIDNFNFEFFQTKKPVLLRNTINHWPALNKWRNPNYLLKIAGNRSVPIEIGTHYADKNWSQELMKIKDFLKRHFNAENSEGHSENIEYLAQHELFDQIPQLKNDIRIPDYCCCTDKSNNYKQDNDLIDIKAWLGPIGTVSPMHQDPKNNILCQVFGKKKIILASCDNTNNLYPHQTGFLNNTSEIDAENLDLLKFPLIKNVKFMHLILQEGECLYIPPKWWHFVKSLSKSFSVSFWWE